MREPHLGKYLEQLVVQGYGRTIREVADYLIDRGIDDLLRFKVLTPLSKEDLYKRPNLSNDETGK